ncbi:MAG: post-transcriptional regulator [Nitrosarchaeum sp.]|nr:post-transcriptional regulator [Nitrosarchaeum sp.]
MLPLLFDEMYEGKAEEFRKLGYHAVSVRELRDWVLKYNLIM